MVTAELQSWPDASWYITVFKCTVLFCTLWNFIVLCSTVLYCTALFCTLWQFTVLSTVIYCTELFCKVWHITLFNLIHPGLRYKSLKKIILKADKHCKVGLWGNIVPLFQIFRKSRFGWEPLSGGRGGGKKCRNLVPKFLTFCNSALFVYIGCLYIVEIMFLYSIYMRVIQLSPH